MSGIGLVFNPRAGRNRRDPGAPVRLARQLGDHGVVAAPRSIDELHRVAEDFRRQKIEVLGIAGGDGTNYVTITGFHQVYAGDPLPTLALLRGGTMNTVANSLGLPKGRTAGLLDRLVERYLETEALPALEQWTLDVEGKLGFLWGIGVIPGYLSEYYASGTPSPWTAAKTLARCIGSATIGGSMIRRMTRSEEVSVEMDTGETWEKRPYLSVAAGTIEGIGLGFRPFRRAGEIPGSFHLLGIHTSPFGFVAELPRLHRAEAMTPAKASDALVRRATIRTSESSIRYVIDGDVLVHPHSELTVRIGPIVRIATMN